MTKRYTCSPWLVGVQAIPEALGQTLLRPFTVKIGLEASRSES